MGLKFSESQDEALCRRFFQSMAAARKTCQEWGLSPAEAHLILLLSRVEPIPMASLAAEIARSPSTITALTDHLEAKALVSRLEDPNNRRIRPVVLTEEGQRLRTRLMKTIRVFADLR